MTEGVAFRSWYIQRRYFRLVVSTSSARGFGIEGTPAPADLWKRPSVSWRHGGGSVDRFDAVHVARRGRGQIGVGRPASGTNLRMVSLARWLGGDTKR